MRVFSSNGFLLKIVELVHALELPVADELAARPARLIQVFGGRVPSSISRSSRIRCLMGCTTACSSICSML